MIYVAWRILTHEVGRSLLAVGGIFVAILMIFLQLGFFACVPSGGLMVYKQMIFDILLTSSDYVYQAETFSFPRRRLYQALANPEVLSASPVYMGAVQWTNEQAHEQRHEIFVIGFKPRDKVFDAPDLTRQLSVLERDDTVLVDKATYPVFGAMTPGRVTEMNNHAVTIGGTYVLGIGFLGLGCVAISDINFLRMMPDRPLTSVNLGLVRLKPGADPEEVARQLRAVMPDDVRVFTRNEFIDYETSYWVTRTSTGLIFGFGAVIALIVGVVILYQTLSTQVSRQLPQYATFKAMGYTDRYLGGIVIWLALLMAAVAFPPAYGAAIGIYNIIHEATKLPITMTEGRLAAVLGLTLAMSIASALYSVRGLRRADPVDLF
jgi:putative ABC transport system permease protein